MSEVINSSIRALASSSTQVMPHRLAISIFERPAWLLKLARQISQSRPSGAGGTTSAISAPKPKGKVSELASGQAMAGDCVVSSQEDSKPFLLRLATVSIAAVVFACPALLSASAKLPRHVQLRSFSSGAGFRRFLNVLSPPASSPQLSV